MLTVLGILLGFFVLLVKDGQSFIDSNLIILPSLGTAISMFISGMSGSYLSEKAEQKKLNLELKKAMANYIKEEESEEESDEEEKSSEEIKKAMLTVNINQKEKKRLTKRGNEKKKRITTLQEKAERFATIVVSIVNGGAPFIGGLVPLIPFFLIAEANMFVFVGSFIIIFACIILLGVFLGKISKESILKNVLQMLAAFILTIVIAVILLG